MKVTTLLQNEEMGTENLPNTDWFIKAVFTAQDLEPSKRGLWGTIISKLKSSKSCKNPSFGYVCFREFVESFVEKHLENFNVPLSCRNLTKSQECVDILESSKESPKEHKIVAELLVSIEDFQIKDKEGFRKGLEEAFHKSIKSPASVLLRIAMGFGIATQNY